ncbi:MAG: NfeD family protein [Bacteroidales bacterium]|nr:NfeD family protein [Bacteroidales bacterium]
MGLIITLIVLGIILIIAEILIIPGFAITGILGVISLGASCYFGFNYYGQTGGIIVLIVDILLITCFIFFALRSKTWKKISLNTNIDSKVDSQPEEKGIEAKSEGVTVTRLNPMGRARFGDKETEVRSLDGIIDPKTEIVVAYIENEKIFVNKK